MNFNGHAIYGTQGNRKVFIGIVSQNFERKATCTTIPTLLKKGLVEIEDKRFYQHGAIDVKSIFRALIKNFKAGKIIQGGSTITQQLARNLLKDNRKNYLRKLKEIVYSIKLENKYSKKSIITLYFNEVFWGKKSYGIRAASLYYFFKEPKNLSSKEQIALLTLLRGPNFYLKNDVAFLNRYHLINNLLFERKIISEKDRLKNRNPKLSFANRPIEVFNNDSINFISNKIDFKSHTIQSSLIKDIQNQCSHYVKESRFPVSVICLKDGKVVGMASKFGSSHPFIFKSNVGSTLKPFLYVFFRKKGIAKNQIITSNSNIKWDVREVINFNKKISLKNALFYSNNNVFINTAYEVGIEESLAFLSKVLEKPETDIFPSSILGATKNGLSLYELTIAYYKFFFQKTDNDPIKKECLDILSEIALSKLKIEGGLFLKSGTTNDNKEQIFITGRENFVFAFLKGEINYDEYYKENIGFKEEVGSFLGNFFRQKDKKRNRNYSLLNN